MKLKTALLATLFATLTGLHLSVQAAEEKAAPDKATTDKPAEAKVEKEKPKKKKAKPHSHMEEKTGMSAPMPDESATPKKPLHDHRKENK